MDFNNRPAKLSFYRPEGQKSNKLLIIDGITEYLINPVDWERLALIRILGGMSWLLPLMTALLLNRFDHKAHRHILVFIVFTCLMDHVSTHPILSNIFHDKTNSPWYHLGTPFLFFLMSLFYGDLLLAGKYRRLRWLLPIAFLAIATVSAFIAGAFYRFPSVSVGLYSFSGIVFAVVYLLHQLRSKEITLSTKQPLFWTSTGFLVYYTGSIMVWGGLNFLNQDYYLFNSIYRVIGVMTIFLNLCFTVAIYCLPEMVSRGTSK